MNVSLNEGKCTFELPVSFSRMSEAEIRSMGGKGATADMQIFVDKKHHVILQPMVSKVPFLVRWVSTAQLAANTARKYSEQAPEFSDMTDFSTTVSGIEARGFRYNYVAQGIPSIGIYLIFKTKKHMYAISCSGRQSNRETCEKLFDETVATIKVEG